MNLQQETRTLPMDEHYEPTLKQWADEGWGLVPNTKPMVTLQICRQVRGDVLGPQLTMGVDEDKVFIIRANGKVEKA